MKTAELTGVALDWAVFKAGHEGAELHYFVDDPFKKEPWLLINGISEMPLRGCYTPTTDWAQGGPIIERYRITIQFDGDGIRCDLTTDDGGFFVGFDESSPLIAAMRCYVASKLGDEVEIQEELK